MNNQHHERGEKLALLELLQETHTLKERPMLRETGKRMAVCGILVVIAAVGLVAWLPARAADPPPKPLKSGIVSFDDAPAHQADWGEMRRTSPARRPARRMC